jgi:hypothetical protein
MQSTIQVRNHKNQLLRKGMEGFTQGFAYECGTGFHIGYSQSTLSPSTRELFTLLRRSRCEDFPETISRVAQCAIR